MRLLAMKCPEAAVLWQASMMSGIELLSRIAAKPLALSL